MIGFELGGHDIPAAEVMEGCVVMHAGSSWLVTRQVNMIAGDKHITHLALARSTMKCTHKCRAGDMVRLVEDNRGGSYEYDPA